MIEPLKIALLHDSILPPKTYGGIERIVVNLAYEFKRLGHDVRVICRKGSQLEDFETIALPPDYKTRHPDEWVPRDIDFLHAHQPLPLKPSRPFLVTIHGNGHEGETYWPNTNFLSQSHARNHAAQTYIYNGVDPKLYPFTKDKDDYYVFLARASWRVKNLKTTITWARDLGVKLHVMGGTGTNDELITYHGMVGEKEKLPLLSRAKALVYVTNWDEPCAVAPLEALACGTPVIASTNGCMPELVRPGTGVVCASYEEMLAAPARLASIDPAACRRSVEEVFSVTRMADDYLKLFQKIRTRGELDQSPHYAFSRASVRYLYKPTLVNRLRFAALGKI